MTARAHSEGTWRDYRITKSREYLKHIGIASLRESSESGGGDVVDGSFSEVR